MRKLLLLLCIPLFADVPLNIAVDPQIIPTNNVNVVTGDYIDAPVDYTTKTVEPIPIQRIHVSGYRPNGHFGEWRFQVNRIQSVPGGAYVLEEADGSVAVFNSATGKLSSLNGMANTSAGSIGGKTNMRNWTVEQVDEEVFLSKPNGERSRFVRAGKFFFLEEKQLPSGNILLYAYDEQDRPSEIRLVSGDRTSTLGWVKFAHTDQHDTRTTLVTTSDERTLSYLYRRHDHASTHLTGWLLDTVTFPDGRTESLSYNGWIHQAAAFPLNSQTSPSGTTSQIVYTAISGELTPPEGRARYDSPSLTRVYNIQEQTSHDDSFHNILTFKYGLSLAQNWVEVPVKPPPGVFGFDHTFFLTYDTVDLNWREIYDAANSRTRFYIESGRVAKIDYPSGGRELRSWGNGDDETYLLAKSHQAASGDIIHARTFSYDANGNVTQEAFRGNLTGRDHTPLQVDRYNYPNEHSVVRSPNYSEQAAVLHLFTRLSDYYRSPGNDIWGEQHRADKALKFIQKKKLRKKYWKEINATLKSIATAFRVCHHAGPKEPEPFLKHFLDIVKRGTAAQAALSELPIAGTPETHSKTFTYSDDGFNNLLTETASDTTTKYTYKPDTDLITSRLTYDTNGPQKEEYFEYDENAALTQIRIKHGSTELTTTYTNREDGLPLVIDEPLKRTHLHYDQHNQVIQKDIYDANGVYQYSTYTDYDEKGQVVREVDVLGQETLHTYDERGNRIRTQTPRKELITTFTYDFANRLIATTITDSAGNAISNQTSYDLMSRKTSETDTCGNSTHYEYDAMSNVTKVTYPTGSSVTRTYDSLGNILTETNENDDTTTYQYNARKQPIHIHHPDDTTESFQYKLNGHLESHTHKNGSTTIYTRDYLGRVLTQKLIAPDDTLLTETSTSYDGPNKSTYTDGEGHTTTYSYDSIGRLVQETKGDQTTTYSYDSLGRLTHTQKGDKVTLLTYDLLDRVIEKRVEDTYHALYSLVQFIYDGDGNKVTTTSYQREDEPLHTHTTYDLLGKPTSITDPLGHTSTTTYDRAYSYQNTQVLRTIHTDANGLQTITIHDPRGRPISIEKKTFTTLSLTDIEYDPAGNPLQKTHTVYPSKRTTTTRWEYGPGGRLDALYEPNNKTTLYAYNSAGELETTVKPSGVELHRSYDPVGRLQTHRGPDFSYTYCYDHNNNITEVTSQTGTTTRSYDPHQNITSETLETGITLSYTYDEQGRRLTTTLPDDTQIDYTYNAAHLQTVTRNGYTHRYLSYDLQGNLLSEQHISGYQETYTYDPLGRLTSNPRTTLTYDPVGNLIKTSDNTYTYDDLNQLTSENDHTYTYDSLHNRTSHNQETYKINALNQITGLSYDADGRLLSYNDQTYTYDSLDRLTSVDETQYTYDPFNRRLSKNDTHFIYDHQCEIGAIQENNITELRILGRSRGAEIGAAVLIELDHYAYTPTHDHRGSVISLSSPLSEETYTYTAYGECTVEPSSFWEPTNNPYRFLSKRHDPESNLTYFGRRYYNPSLGRWQTPDPKGLSEGPNLYAYVLNNPLTNIDLWGLAMRAAAVQQRLNRLDPSKNIVSHYPLRFNTGSQRQSNWTDPTCSPWARSLEPSRHPKTKGASLRLFNGVDNKYWDATYRQNTFGNMTGREVRMTFTPTWGVPVDVATAGLAVHRIPTPAVVRTYLDIMSDLASHSGDVWLLPHSRGAAHVYSACHWLSAEDRARLHIRSFGGAKMIPNWMGASVVNYVAKNDPVPRLDPMFHLATLGLASGYTIDMIEPPRGGPWENHEALGPAYELAHRRVAAEFQDAYPEVIRYE